LEKCKIAVMIEMKTITLLCLSTLVTFTCIAQKSTPFAVMLYGGGSKVVQSPDYSVTGYSSEYTSAGGGFSVTSGGFLLGIEVGADLKNSTDSIEERSLLDFNLFVGGLQKVGSGRLQIPITGILSNHSLTGDGRRTDFSSTYVGGRSGFRFYIGRKVFTEFLVSVTSPVYLGYRGDEYDTSGLRTSVSINFGFASVSDDY